MEQQFDTKNEAFIPRAFSLTHINLTHRNWTAVGIPDFPETAIVDPRGLVTPFFDGCSLDSWIVTEKGLALLPSRLQTVSQYLKLNGNLAVITRAFLEKITLELTVEVVVETGIPTCRICLAGSTDTPGWIVVTLQPYKPDEKGWKINNQYNVFFDEYPDRYTFSHYRTGYVYHHLLSNDNKHNVTCDVDTATSAALFAIHAGGKKGITIHIPLKKDRKYLSASKKSPLSSSAHWEQSIHGMCKLCITDKRFQFLYDSAIKTLILHSPDTIYTGPYTYKRFWFRDATFIILHVLLRADLPTVRKESLTGFPIIRQTSGISVLRRENEILMVRFFGFCNDFVSSLVKKENHNGEVQLSMLPGGFTKNGSRIVPIAFLRAYFLRGFSAEHLGPSDYYWDNFWSFAGLRTATHFLDTLEEHNLAEEFRKEADSLINSVERSLRITAERLYGPVMPASPYSRLDSGAIGSLATKYPLQLWEPHDSRLMDTVKYLLDECLVDGGFFHDMIHLRYTTLRKYSYEPVISSFLS